MRLIYLTKGKVAKVSDRLYPLLKMHKWCAHSAGYACRRKPGGGMLLMHREVWRLLGRRIPDQIDHKDCDRLNNQTGNLRPATASQQQANKQKRRVSTSIYKGVYWSQSRSQWSAECRGRNLGFFSCERSAALAYDVAALRAFGQRARINFT